MKKGIAMGMLSVLGVMGGYAKGDSVHQDGTVSLKLQKLHGGEPIVSQYDARRMRQQLTVSQSEMSTFRDSWSHWLGLSSASISETDMPITNY